MPECLHFGSCGGCSLQHLSPDDYAAHKLSLLTNAMARHGVEALDIRPLLMVPPATRRRIELVATRNKLGFHERGKPTVVNVTECLVARPELVTFLPLLRSALISWLKVAGQLDVMLTHYASGIDVLITGTEPDLTARQEMAEFASIQKLPRVSWRTKLGEAPEPMFQAYIPTLTYGTHTVATPAGVFLQPSTEGESLLFNALLPAVKGPKVADLFSGMGSFGLRLPHDVTFYEGDRAAHLTNPAKHKHQRDLFRDPLTPAELAIYNTVLLDPPRQGAKAQCAELAKSQVPSIIYVSCNPDTFARDAKLLASRYQLNWIRPIDQFLWAEHLELVGLFTQH
jgi:23S rRNA (uracil1939-C5)-methyltransferase